MTFEEFQEAITSIGFNNSVVESGDDKGLPVKDLLIKDGAENVLMYIPIRATNMLEIGHHNLSDRLDHNELAQLNSLINNYLATPIGKRGLEQHSSNPGVSERLNREWSDLDEKLDSLNTFMHSEKFGALPGTQARLLDFQYQIMGIYQKIVAWRIQTLGEGGQDDVD